MSDLLGELDHLSGGLAGGQLSPVAWHNEVAAALFEHHLAAYALARNKEVDDPEVLAAVKGIVGRQIDYLNALTDDVEAGRYADSTEALQARAALYAGALSESYSKGQWGDWDLPFHPTEGSECMTNCHCHWEVADNEDGTGSAVWHLGAAEHHCETCPARADGSPYDVKRKAA